MHQGHAGFIPGMQGWFDIHISKCNAPHKQNQGQKPHDHLNAEKPLDETQHPFYDKSSEETRNRRTYLIIKPASDKPTASITQNEEKLKSPPLGSGTRVSLPTPTGIPSQSNKARERNKGFIQVGKEEVKLTLKISPKSPGSEKHFWQHS
jgi:hypothetical protein